nr:hypothetical protein [Tanacetum cinerariifolium]
MSSAMIVYPSEVKASEDKPSEDEPPFKKLKFFIPEPSNPRVPSLTPLNSIPPQDLKQKLKALFDKELKVKQLSWLNMKLKEPKRSKNTSITSHSGQILYPSPRSATRNLVPPSGVEGRKGLVIKEPLSGIFFYNGNFDLSFQTEEEFHLATTTQLIKLLNDIQKDSPRAEEMFAKINMKIEARNDVFEARKIVKVNLDGLSQHM